MPREALSGGVERKEGVPEAGGEVKGKPEVGRKPSRESRAEGELRGEVGVPLP